MSSEQPIKKAYTLDQKVEVGKFTTLVQSTVNYSDGCSVPAGANAAGILGVAQESVLPSGVADYSGGTYTLVSGTAWPANSIPTQGQGLKIGLVRHGISRVVASGAVNRGDWVNIADNQGRIKTVSEAAGTLVHVLGQAEDAATTAGDVIRVFVQPHSRHT